MSERLFVAGGPDSRLIIAWGAEGLAELQRDDARQRSAVGRIHLGKVAAVDRRLGAAFVEIGAGPPGLLPLRGRPASVAEGQKLIVEVRRDGSGAKGPRLSRDVALTGHWLVLRPAGGAPATAEAGPAAAIVAAQALPGEAWRVRPTAAADVTAERLAAEMARLRERWAAIRAKAETARPPGLLAAADDPVFAMLRDRPAAHWTEIVLDHRASAERLQAACAAALPLPPERIVYRPRRDWAPDFALMREQLMDALDEDVALPGGGWIRIESGSAATLIDVNSGDAAAGGDPEATFLKLNQAAARAIARQLRLRNIGGLVVVDFIDLASRRGRQSVAATLREALADDPAPWSVGEMSALGLVELTRRRRGRSLREAFTEACSQCGGSGRTLRRDPLLT